MQLRHLRVIFWIGFFLLAVELALEVRAANRGWEALLLGKQIGWQASGDEGYGPRDGFPFRSAVLEPERSAGVQRVWVCSSSYGADLQLEPELIFPNLLGTNLTERGRPTQTLNSSVDGYTIPRNIVDLREFGPTWRPDVVVLYQLSNDIDQIARFGALAASGSVGQGEAADSGPNQLHALVEQTTLYKHLKSTVTSRLTRGRVLRDSFTEADAQALELRVREFVRAVRELGARPVLCTFATSHVRSNIDQLPSEYELNLLRFNLELSLAGWLDGVERGNALIERVAREEGLQLVDLATPLAGHPELFRDFWHMRAEGHAIAARALAAALYEDFE